MSSSYRVEVTRTAQKEILKLQTKIRRQVESTIDRLISTLNSGKRPQDMKRIEGYEHRYRIDSGQYRILFYLFEEPGTIRITNVKHRKAAYRNL